MEGWQPLEVVREDIIVASPLKRLAALLDHDASHWPAEQLPPLGHWLYFLPDEKQSDLTIDGHPVRGALLPPIKAPRRMWAGGDIVFHAPIEIGMAARRTSIVTDVTEKAGSTGKLTFIRVRHEISCEGLSLVTEMQDLVYREGGIVAANRPPGSRTPDTSKPFTLNEAALFRFSALTFNSHRIHYDRAYATATEGYPALVVHGPFQAMMLIDHLLRYAPDRPVVRFRFRGASPLFEKEEASQNQLNADGAAELWTANSTGVECMTASAFF